jgi:ABC-type amino acid transport system permease subunit
MNRLWFRARDYGWGWTPVTLEGWLVMLAFLVAIGAVTAVFLYQLRHGADPGRATRLFMLGIAILCGIVVAICWATGERPRWRWGE